MSAPVEITISAIFSEYRWDVENALSNLVALGEALQFYGVECIPPIGQGDLNQPRVLRKRTVEGISTIIESEIVDGENAKLEFKSSLAFHRQKKSFSPNLPIRDYNSIDVLFSALKTIAAFANTVGGTLLIGVEDNGKIIGIEDDYLLLRRPGQEFDGWELSLRDAIQKYFAAGQSINSYVAVQRAYFDTRCVARIQVAPRSQLSFLNKDGQSILYIRSGNRSTPVPFEEIEHYFELRKRYE